MIKFFLALFFLSIVHAFGNVNWSPTLQIDQGKKSVLGSDIAVDRKGNAVVVWRNNQGIFAAYYDAMQENWSRHTVLSRENATAPSIVVNDEGYAVASWALKYVVQVAHFDPQTKTWSSNVSISGKGDFGRPSVSMDEGGNTIVAWNNLGAPQIQSASYDAMTQSWSPPVTLAGEGARVYIFDEQFQYPQSPVVQLNRGGAGMAAWVVIKDEKCVVQGSCYDAGLQCWDNPIEFSREFPSVVINGKKTGTSFDLSLSESGIATVVWESQRHSPPCIQYVEYDVYEKKKLGLLFTQIACCGVYPKIFTSGNGKIALSFNSIDPTTILFPTILPFQTGAKVDSLSRHSFGSSFSFEMASGIDQEGNILTTWSDCSEETLKQYVAHYHSDSKKWSKPVCLSTCPFVRLGFPVLDVHEEGHAALSWYTYDPDNQIHVLNVSLYYPNESSQLGGEI